MQLLLCIVSCHFIEYVVLEIRTTLYEIATLLVAACIPPPRTTASMMSLWSRRIPVIIEPCFTSDISRVFCGMLSIFGTVLVSNKNQSEDGKLKCTKYLSVVATLQILMCFFPSGNEERCFQISS